MFKLNKIVFALAGALSVQVALAATVVNPTVIPFSEAQNISKDLSYSDVNRLTVIGDQIHNVTCLSPSGAVICNISYDSSDNTGSAYISLKTTDPFTMYITTVQDRNFSIFVTPQSVPGETYIFQPTTPGTNAGGWEKDTDYEDLNVTIISDLINNQPPDGFGYQQCSTDTPCINMQAQKQYGVIQMTPMAEYDGDNVIGLIYQITNTGKEAFTAAPSAYYTAGVRAIAEQKQTLQGGESGYLYEVITNPNANLGD